MEKSIMIYKDKCIGCSSCVKDCVAFNLKMEEGKAVVAGKNCIYCGHCEAICPVGAVEITGFADVPEEFTEDTRLDPQTLLMAIKTRRSVRIFKEDPVAKEIVDDILEAGRLAPTGGNAQNISYVVLDQKKKEYEEIGVKLFRRLISLGKMSAFVQNLTIDDDFFFKKAPVVILIAGSGAVNASLAAENMAFMAEAHGLGVLYSGFFTMVANTNRKIKKQLGLKKGHKVITTLVIGYPGVKYHRTVRRNPADVRYL